MRSARQTPEAFVASDVPEMQAAELDRLTAGERASWRQQVRVQAMLGIGAKAEAERRKHHRH